MTWPEDSKTYYPVSWSGAGDRTPNDYRCLAERPSTRCRDAYKRDFGKVYEGELEGELGWQEVQETN